MINLVDKNDCYRTGYMRPSRFKTALVLSGGGSRALAHLGVLDELVNHDTRLDLIVGTSMGAIVGGLYAYHGDMTIVLQKIREFLQSDLFVETLSRATSGVDDEESGSLLERFVGLFRKGIYFTYSIVKSALVTEQAFLQIISDLIPAYPIEKLRVPFAAVAMDIVSGEEVVLRTGCLRQSVAASAAIPGVLPPVQRDGRYLVDGGWVDNVPVTPAIAMGAHFVIGVDAALQIDELGPLPSAALDLLHRGNDITRIALSRERRLCADVLLVPPLGAMNWADFQNLDQTVQAGRHTVLQNLAHLRIEGYRRKARCILGRRHPARDANWRRPMVFL